MAVQITELNNSLPQTDDFKAIVLQQTALIDVRAPIEFAQGAFENAINLPLMTDEERHKVGICYKEHGNAAAVKLGHKLVNEEVRKPRIQAWREFKTDHPTALLYCFRGGMRSKIAQQWLQNQGIDIVRLKGGYKAFRRYLIDSLENFPEYALKHNIQPVVLGGRTGSGKTIVLKQLNQAIDLEALAHHRGSAFGRHATPQPTQINFENRLAMALIRLLETQPQQLIIEDEGRNIGSVNMPKALFDFLKSGPRVILESTLQERLDITLQEYVIQAQSEYASLEAWQEFMLAAFKRIKNRLGGERYERVLKAFTQAIQQQKASADYQAHEAWINILLVEYYDPMYDHQMQKREHKVAFQGNQSEVIEFLNSTEFV